MPNIHSCCRLAESESRSRPCKHNCTLRAQPGLRFAMLKIGDTGNHHGSQSLAPCHGGRYEPSVPATRARARGSPGRRARARARLSARARVPGRPCVRAGGLWGGARAGALGRRARARTQPALRARGGSGEARARSWPVGRRRVSHARRRARACSHVRPATRPWTPPPSSPPSLPG